MEPEWAPCGNCACVDGDAGFDRWEIKEQWKSRICPRRLITPESRHWLILFTHYQAGFLAEMGGILDQSARYVEAMRYINQVVGNG